MIETLFYTQL